MALTVHKSFLLDKKTFEFLKKDAAQKKQTIGATIRFYIEKGIITNTIELEMKRKGKGAK